MKNISRAPLVLSALMSTVAAHAVLVSQNLNDSTVTAGSVSCNAGGVHRDNWYARAFTLSAHGITQPFLVSSVRIGIELAASTSGSQNITINIYDGFTTSGSTMTPGTLIGSNTVGVADTSLSFLTIPIAGLASSGQLVAEVFTPDGTSAGNRFFIGSNNLGQTGPSYIKAPACGVTTLTSLGAIGFGNMHSLISVEGQPVPEPGTMAALALGAIATLRRRKSK